MSSLCRCQPVAVLLSLENQKGSPLAKNEVLEGRDGTISIAMPRDVHESIVKSRGYRDIGPELVWEERLEIRPSLHTGDAWRFVQADAASRGRLNSSGI